MSVDTDSLGSSASRESPRLPREDVSAALASALRCDRWVKGDQHLIEISVEDGAVTLSGSVDTLGSKRRAVALARLLAGGRRVVDAIRRRPAGETSDQALARRAVERLEAEPVFSSYGLTLEEDGDVETIRKGSEEHVISVSADDGVIRLAGSVGSLSHSRVAEVLTWWLEDCQHVNNALTVKPARSDNDDELNDAVRLCLERDPLLDANQVHVETAASIVQLEGLVTNSLQRRRLVQTVWAVPGVWDVDDCTQAAS